jgi:hypothetical protein
VAPRTDPLAGVCKGHPAADVGWNDPDHILAVGLFNLSGARVLLAMVV